MSTGAGIWILSKFKESNGWNNLIGVTSSNRLGKVIGKIKSGDKYPDWANKLITLGGIE
jgi:hypothetical protein